LPVTSTYHQFLLYSRFGLKLKAMTEAIYSNIENLVLWVRSQIIGFAVNGCHGVCDCKNHPAGVKSMPGSLGSDCLFRKNHANSGGYEIIVVKLISYIGCLASITMLFCRHTCEFMKLTT
jgi:hypothetical protein